MGSTERFPYILIPEGERLFTVFERKFRGSKLSDAGGAKNSVNKAPAGGLLRIGMEHAHTSRPARYPRD